MAVPSLGQAVPEAAVPLAQTHCLSAPQTASAVLEAGAAITLPCASQSTACAEHEAPARKKAPEHDAHLAAPLAGQLVLAEPVPLAHVHCLAAPHTASAVFEAGVAMTWPCASQSTACAEHDVPERKNAPEHEAHCAVLCVVHAAPVAPAPLGQVHTFCEHWRSVVVVSSVDTYCVSLHSVWLAHVPAKVSVAAVFMYSVPEHRFTLLHTRFCVVLGAVIWYVAPSVHVSHAEHKLPTR